MERRESITIFHSENMEHADLLNPDHLYGVTSHEEGTRECYKCAFWSPMEEKCDPDPDSQYLLNQLKKVDKCKCLGDQEKEGYLEGENDQYFELTLSGKDILEHADDEPDYGFDDWPEHRPPTYPMG